jgi:uncharacterized protein YydD (DUF2326 family)
MLSLLRENGEHIDLLVHDSHLFDPVDSRQVAHALTTGKELAEEFKFQYVVTMNSDEIPYDYIPEDFDLEACIINPRLSDADEGGLFGIRF